MLNITLANKSDKKDILRFYKANNYSARFIGFDHCYLIKNDHVIVASVIVSLGKAKHSNCASALGNLQYFLHALVVDPTYQKQGLAARLLHYSLTHHRPLVCFADCSLSPLYLKQGFTALSAGLIKKTLTIELFNRFQQYTKQNNKLTVFYYQ